jgi:recombination protein RecT
MATALATRDDNAPATFGEALTGFRNQLEKRANEFKMVLPAHITPEKLQRTVITAVQSDPELLKADRQSLILACMKAAQDGLLPDKREAALVIFKENKKVGSEWVSKQLVQYMPMVYGLRKKILQSGEVTDITAKVVYRRELEEGAFIYEEGTEATLRHRPLMDLSEEEADDSNIVAFYSMATYKDGTKSYEVMRRFEVDKVREKSQTGATRTKRGEPRTPSGPWVEWYPEQGKKTVMRRHSKTLPMSGDLVDVEAHDDALFAASTTQALSSVAPDAPKILPSRTEAAHDPVTGEVIDDETVAELDRQGLRQMDGDADADEVNPGPDDSQRGEDNAGVADAIITEIELRDTVPDINSFMAGRKDALLTLSDNDRERIAIAQDKAVARIKGA